MADEDDRKKGTTSAEDGAKEGKTSKDEEFHVVDLADTEGYIVDDSDEDDPVLITPDGHRVDTWRENYPSDQRMTRKEYEHIQHHHQIAHLH